MGDTQKPSRDKGLYIMTWQHPADGEKRYELINGFGDFYWCLDGALRLRYITETIAQNRFIRIREQFSYWSGLTMKNGEHILTRTLDGRCIIEFRPRNKPVCPACKANVLTVDEFCPKCMNAMSQGIAACRSNACNNNKHEKCKGTGLLKNLGPCECDCHGKYIQNLAEIIKNSMLERGMRIR